MKKLNTQKIEAAGKLWEGYGKKRVYLSQETLLKVAGITVGNTTDRFWKDFTYEGEKISNTYGRELVERYTSGTHYFDCQAGVFVSSLKEELEAYFTEEVEEVKEEVSQEKEEVKEVVEIEGSESLQELVRAIKSSDIEKVRLMVYYPIGRKRREEVEANIDKLIALATGRVKEDIKKYKSDIMEEEEEDEFFLV